MCIVMSSLGGELEWAIESTLKLSRDRTNIFCGCVQQRGEYTDDVRLYMETFV